MTDGMNQRVAIDVLRERVRQVVRRHVDRAVIAGALVAGVFQVVTVGCAGSSPQALAVIAACVVAISLGVIGLSGRASWTPVAYVGMAMVGNAAYMMAYGPLLGVGAAYLAVVAVASMFLATWWRWGVVVVLTLTPLVVGAIYSLGDGHAPILRFSDRPAWTHTMVMTVAAMVAVALVVGYCVHHLVVARQALQQAHAAERAAKLEQARLDHEISRARRADLIVELAAEVGADIGGALRVITSHAESLARELPDDEAQGCLADVIASATSARSTMRSLTLFGANVAHGDAVCDAVYAVRELPRIVRRVVPERIRLEVSAEGACGVPVTATDLVRVLSNLVFNARDAIADTGVVSIAVVATEAHVLIEVRDDGTGMDASTSAGVFQPFFTTKAVGRGTGLGLATAKILVERAGGTLTFTTESGVGTCFTIRLPQVALAGAEPGPRAPTAP